MFLSTSCGAWGPLNFTHRSNSRERSRFLRSQTTRKRMTLRNVRSIVLWAVLRVSIMFRNSFLYSSGVDYVSQFTSVFVLHLSIDSVQFHSSISRKRTSKHRLGTNAHQCNTAMLSSCPVGARLRFESTAFPHPHRPRGSILDRGV